MRTLLLEDISEDIRNQIGGKAYNLGYLAKHSFNIPKGFCLPIGFYQKFVQETDLKQKIFIELNRKPLADMRWEELFDASLRIRNFFNTTPIPNDLYKEIQNALEPFENDKLVVRSSSIAEDGKSTSFAGIHETIVNVSGIDEVIDAIKRVWASLWSDAALLYRKELNLNVNNSRMAVIVQELVSGEKSGVLFTKNPLNNSEAVLEAVYGLNQGMVDGIIAPDRYYIVRDTGEIKESHIAEHNNKVMLSKTGTKLMDLDPALKNSPILAPDEIKILYLQTKKIETLYSHPQDIEWTMKKERIYILQTRPIVQKASSSPQYPQKEWYLNLHRSFTQLQEMQNQITSNIIPEMIRIPEDLDLYDLRALSDDELAFEVKERSKIYQHWNKVYYDIFIPFGHGFRLFGQVYNDAVKPENSFEFLELLQKTNLISMNRNKELINLAKNLTPRGIHTIKDLNLRENQAIKDRLDDFFDQYQNTPFLSGVDKAEFFPFLFELSKSENRNAESDEGEMKRLEINYFQSFPKNKQEFAKNILNLGRYCYEMRDNDNIYLGKIHGQLFKALNEAKERLRQREVSLPELIGVKVQEVINALENENYKPQFSRKGLPPDPSSPLLFRQLKGQPASQGVVSGKCRVFRGNHRELLEFQKGEILVCGAIDPNMTFILPLCAGIIEERGGMLVHGALIAREYGIPCVTGIPHATQIMKTGQTVTVDGFLGLVVIE